MTRSYNICQCCSLTLPHEIAAYAGYTFDGTPIYVGQCCVDKIDELATHVYWWWEADKRCEPDTCLWRYMDFAKFVGLLEARALFFCRADLLGDGFEGAAGIAERRGTYDQFYLDFFRNAVRTAPGQTVPPPTEQVEHEAHRLLAEFTATGERDRKTSFVSCWHANTGESEALWRLYCPPSTVGVAIETTAQALVEAYGNDTKIKLGRVQYVDYRRSFAGIHDRIFWKRKSLSHEAEIRAVATQHGEQLDAGILIPVDVEKLCKSVIPSPFAPDWFVNVLSATIKRFEIDLDITQSELLAEPFF